MSNQICSLQDLVVPELTAAMGQLRATAPFARNGVAAPAAECGCWLEPPALWQVALQAAGQYRHVGHGFVAHVAGNEQVAFVIYTGSGLLVADPGLLVWGPDWGQSDVVGWLG